MTLDEKGELAYYQPFSMISTPSKKRKFLTVNFNYDMENLSSYKFESHQLGASFPTP